MDKMKGFVLAVAPYLEGWVFDAAYYAEQSTVPRLVNAALPGAAVHFHYARNQQRARILGLYPQGYCPASETRAAITVGITRDPQVVARDIERRFLDDYVAQFKAAMDRAYADALALRKARDMADELGQILGESPRHGNERSRIWTRHGSFEVVPSSSGVYITIQRLYSITPEMAVGIAQALAESRE